MRETRGFRWLRRIGLTALTLVVSLPLYVVVVTSVTSLGDVQGAFSWVPRHVDISSYTQMGASIPLGRYLRNSLVVSVAATVLALVVAAPAGYVLGRSRRMRGVGFLLLATQAVPGLLFLLPLYLGYAKLGELTGIHLIGSYTGLVLTDLVFALPLTVWLISVHVSAIRVEVEDAARVDGAGTVGVLGRVVLPLAAPGIVAAGVFAFILAWSEVLFATVLTDADTTTLPIGLFAYATQSTVHWNQLMAAALATSFPIVVAFVACQRAIARNSTRE